MAGSVDGLTKMLDEASANGWEMVSYSIATNGNLVCFKRPQAGPPTQPPGAAPASAPSA
jgi:hypothetical protein